MEADVDSTFGDTEKVELIKAVKEYRFMYDKVHIWYSDGAKRDTAWREIGSIIDHPAMVCKLEWASLINGFKSSRKRKKVLRPWKFDAPMDYLTPYININDDDKSNNSTPAIVSLLDDDIAEEQNHMDYLSDESDDPTFDIQESPDSPDSPNVDDVPDMPDSPIISDIPDLKPVYSPDFPDTELNSDDDLPIENELTNGTGAEPIEEIRRPQTPMPVFVSSTPGISTQSVAEKSQESPIITFALNDISSRNQYLIFDAPEFRIPEAQQNVIHQNVVQQSLIHQNVNSNANKEIEKVSSTSNTMQMDVHHRSTPTLTVAQKDEVDMFFTSIAATVKRFSPLNRAMVKSKVFAVISEVEMAEIAKQQ